MTEIKSLGMKAVDRLRNPLQYGGRGRAPQRLRVLEIVLPDPSGGRERCIRELAGPETGRSLPQKQGNLGCGTRCSHTSSFTESACAAAKLDFPAQDQLRSQAGPLVGACQRMPPPPCSDLMLIALDAHRVAAAPAAAAAAATQRHPATKAASAFHVPLSFDFLPQEHVHTCVFQGVAFPGQWHFQACRISAVEDQVDT